MSQEQLLTVTAFHSNSYISCKRLLRCPRRRRIANAPPLRRQCCSTSPPPTAAGLQAACTAAAPATPSPVCGAQATPPVTQMRQRTTWTGSCQRSRQVEAALPPPDGCVLATSSCTKLQQQSQRVCLCASLLTAWLVPNHPIVLGCSIMCCPASLSLECGKNVPIMTFESYCSCCSTS